MLALQVDVCGQVLLEDNVCAALKLTVSAHKQESSDGWRDCVHEHVLSQGCLVGCFEAALLALANLLSDSRGILQTRSCVGVLVACLHPSMCSTTCARLVKRVVVNRHDRIRGGGGWRSDGA